MGPVAALDEGIFQDGTSEIKNWVPLAGAMAELGFEPTVVDYVPCYRSEAGTGNAMGFVHWLP
jgi:3-O-methylgallate 3,4-dioxygenase